MSSTSTPPSKPEAAVAIIGGGASGLTAALFLARAGIAAEVFDQDRSILKRALLHNLPGASDMEGRSLLADLRQKCDAIGVVRRAAKVEDVTPLEGGGFTVTAEDGSTSTVNYVVLASGQGTVKLASLPLETTDARQPFVKVNVVTDRWGATSVPGVYACGVVAGYPSQAVACAGSGATVAVEIASAVKGSFWVDHDDTAMAADPA